MIITVHDNPIRASPYMHMHPQHTHIQFLHKHAYEKSTSTRETARSCCVGVNLLVKPLLEVASPCEKNKKTNAPP